jgi:carotenoid cleavage dioxygenase-like enzyme
VGLESIEGEGPGIMTAHPKIDPKTGEMLIFGYSPTPPHLLYHVISAAGELVRTEEITVPFPAMMHDFMVTDEHVLFPIFPAVFDFEAMAEGTSILSWKPELGTHIGVMPRNGGDADVQWLPSDPCYAFHFANAQSQGDRITAEIARFPALPLFGGTESGPPNFWRWHIDLAGGSVKEEQIDDIPTDFPRIDERFAGRPYRYSWGPALAGNSLVQYDVANGERKFHSSREGTSLGEAVFVPRTPDGEEGDGFVLTLAYRADEKRSDLLILDGRDIEAEPLAVAQLPIRVPSGFHGNWRPA